jgi:phosphatidylglycerophosphate synthase
MTRDELSAAPAAGDERDHERARLDAAVKANDGFFTTFFVSPYSKYVARWAARRGWTPNVVTTLSMAVGLLAAAAFATGERLGLVGGAVLLQLAFTLDCVDGQLARYTRTFSRFGAWLDSIFDRGKEYIVYAGLAIGSAAGGDDVWLLASAAMALQTVRHTMDFSFNTAREQAATVTLERSPDSSVTTWLRKIVVLPIGERFALISLTAAFLDARAVFVALLAWGGVALLYTGAGRLLRSLGRRRETSLGGRTGDAPGPLPACRDDGPLAVAIGRMSGSLPPLPPPALAVLAALPLAVATIVAGADASWGVAGGVVAFAVLAGGASSSRPLIGRLRWTVPPVLCAIECGGLLWIAAVAGSSSLPAAFALIGAIAFRRYDLVYRWREQGSLPPLWLQRASGGWDGRLVAGCAIAAAGAAPTGLWVAAGMLGLMLIGERVASWAAYDSASQPPASGGGGDD